MKKSVITLTAFALLFFGGNLQAQPGWNWGDQVDVAKEKYALFSDYMKSAKYADAIPHHDWLLENTPELNESLYQNGAKMYESLANSESDAAKKEAYKEKCMSMYDMRIQYYGREAYILNRKVFPAYKFYKDDKSKYQELYDMFARAFELNGNDFYDNNIVGYMDVVRRHYKTGGDIPDEKVIEIYTDLTDVLDFKRSEGKNVERIDKMANTVDQMLAGTIDLNCDYVESILGPKLEGEDNVKYAKKVFQLMLSGKCTDRPLAFKAADIINNSEPTYQISKFLAGTASKNDEKDKAREYYNMAIELTDDGIKKAEIYMSLARLDASEGNKRSARTKARQALAFDPSAKEAYSLVGNLYMSSFDECKAGEKKTHDYAIFIAAFNQYQRGGDTEGMAKAQALFPTIADIFSEEYEEGQTYQVGCWINESVKLVRRPEN